MPSKIRHLPHLEPTMMGQAPCMVLASPTPEACRLYQNAAKISEIERHIITCMQRGLYKDQMKLECLKG